MRIRNSGIIRLVIALTLSAAQLLSAAWIPVVHAQMAAPNEAPAYEQAKPPDCTAGHHQTLCCICSASYVYAPEAYGFTGLAIASREYTYLGVTLTALRLYRPATGNAIRAPPLW